MPSAFYVPANVSLRPALSAVALRLLEGDKRVFSFFFFLRDGSERLKTRHTGSDVIGLTVLLAKREVRSTIVDIKTDFLGKRGFRYILAGAREKRAGGRPREREWADYSQDVASKWRNAAQVASRGEIER